MLLGIYFLVEEFVIYSPVEIAFVRLVFSSGSNSIKIQFRHEPFNRLMVYRPSFVLKLQRNPSIAITLMVTSIDG